MPEPREQAIARFRKMRAQLMASIDGLTDDQITEPTVDGWSVKDNLAHIAFWDDLRADEVVRISAGHESALKMNGEQDEAANALAYALRRDLSLEQVRWELQHSRQRLEDALAAATPRALDPSNYGEAGLLSTHDAVHAEFITNWRKRMGY
jgi:uncharacterized damage-inducible protein DinB